VCRHIRTRVRCETGKQDGRSPDHSGRSERTAARMPMVVYPPHGDADAPTQGRVQGPARLATTCPSLPGTSCSVPMTDAVPSSSRSTPCAARPILNTRIALVIDSLAQDDPGPIRLYLQRQHALSSDRFRADRSATGAANRPCKDGTTSGTRATPPEGWEKCSVLLTGPVFVGMRVGRRARHTQRSAPLDRQSRRLPRRP
jgi:hypothetical protein